jgi:hypothetical protein
MRLGRTGHRLKHITEILWSIDPLLEGDCKHQPLLWSARSLCVRCDVTVEEVMQAVFSIGPLRGYVTRTCSVEDHYRKSSIERKNLW